MQLQESVALITGASSGIGQATALLFAKEGAAVALVGRDREALAKTAAEIETSGGRSFAVQADVKSAEQCQHALQATITQFGHLNVLVNAAGIFSTGSITSTSLAAWREMMQVNLEGVFMMMQLAVPHLEKTRGSIVNVSSVTGPRAFANVLAYCVSKAGVDQLTRCAALDLASKGIRVNGVNPGVVVTNLHRRGGFEEAAYTAFLEHSKTTHPLGRVGEADEIARSILFLASENSGWITGVTLNIDGGRHLTCAR